MKFLTLAMALFLGSANAGRWDRLMRILGFTNSGEITAEEKRDTPPQDQHQNLVWDRGRPKNSMESLKVLELLTRNQNGNVDDIQPQNSGEMDTGEMETLTQEDLESNSRKSTGPIESVSQRHYKALGLVDRDFYWDKNTDEITCGQVEENYNFYYNKSTNDHERDVLNRARDAIYTDKQCDLFYGYKKLDFVNDSNQWEKNYHDITCKDIDERYADLYDRVKTPEEQKNLHTAKMMIHATKGCAENTDLPLL